MPKYAVYRIILTKTFFFIKKALLIYLHIYNYNYKYFISRRLSVICKVPINAKIVSKCRTLKQFESKVIIFILMFYIYG